MRYPPRWYQDAGIGLIRNAWRAGKRRIVYVAPTGSGKTVVASAIIEGATAKGNSVLFLAHRKELIEQCSRTLDEIGVDHGVIKSGHWRRRPDLPVQVASLQTLASQVACERCKDARKIEALLLKDQYLDGKVPAEAIVVPCERCNSTGRVPKPMPEAKIVVIDETHRCLAPSYQQILTFYPHALILGLTATPWRLDGRGLGAMYEEIISTVQVQQLVDEGFLLPIRGFYPDIPDLSRVKIKRNGEYDEIGIAAIMGSDKLVGNIIEHWKRHGENQRTVVFASSVANSQHIVGRFREVGVAAEHLDGSMKEKDRDAILARLASGETRVVSNVDVLVEGWDLPSLGCVVLARPTKSLVRYLQQVGRGMRPSPGQSYMILLDHAGCTHEHGAPTEPRRWSLDDRQRKKKGDVDFAMDDAICNRCGESMPAGLDACPHCAKIQIVMFKGILHEREEDLVEMRSRYLCEKCNSDKVKLEPWGDLQLKVVCRSCKGTTYTVDRHAAKQASEDRRRKEFERLRRVQVVKGFRPGWSRHKFREIFGNWPPFEWGR